MGNLREAFGWKRRREVDRGWGGVRDRSEGWK